MKQPSRRTLLVVAQIMVSAGLLAYLLTRADVARLAGLWAGIRQPYLWLAVGLHFGGVLISSLKWWLLLRAAGTPVPYSWTVRVYLIGQFFSNFLPTQIGGDAVRVLYLSRRIGRPALAIASVFVERVTGFLALTLIAAAALGAQSGALRGSPRVLLGVVACVLVAAGGLVIAFAAPWLVRLAARLPLPDALAWRRRLGAFADSMGTFYAFPATLALVIALAFGYQISWVAENYVGALALGLAVPPSFVALIVPVADIVGLVPIFFNSLGAREGTFVLLLGQIGVPAESALALSFLIFALRLAASVVGGALYAFGGLERLRPSSNSP
jgi:glycosyltransferase 2 family protein